MAKYREVTRAIEGKVPGPPARSGSEQNRWAEVEGRRVLRVTHPKVHSRGDLPTGTLHSIRKQLRLSSAEFERFVDCDMTGTEYEALIKRLIVEGKL